MESRSKSPLLRLAAGLVAVVLGLLGYHELGGDGAEAGSDRSQVESGSGSDSAPTETKGSADSGKTDAARAEGSKSTASNPKQDAPTGARDAVERAQDVVANRDSKVADPKVEKAAARILVDVPGVGAVDLTETIARIERGERHSHRNDGSVFQNREGLLPKKSSGYYHEYVHPTPGQSGPGARRVVLGAEGETYYTHDHYESFQKVPRG